MELQDTPSLSEDERRFDNDSDDEPLAGSHQLAHFSSTEERFIKEHDLKAKALEALHWEKERRLLRGAEARPRLQLQLLWQLAPRLRPPLFAALPHEVKRRPSIIDLPPQSHHASAVGAATALPEATPLEELVELYRNIAECLAMRHRYLRLLVQDDDARIPKNHPLWRIYPPPPLPHYKLKNPYNQVRPQALPQPLDAHQVFDYAAVEFPPKVEGYEIVTGGDDVYNVRRVAEADGAADGAAGGGAAGGEATAASNASGDATAASNASGEATAASNASGEATAASNASGAATAAADTVAEFPICVPSLHDYYRDLNTITRFSSDGPAKLFLFKRLQYLETKWNLYLLLHDYQETKELKQNPHRDFYNVRKVDTHIHHLACMNQKHLLRYIKYKLKTCPDEEVIFRDGHVLTLAQVFELLHLTGYDLLIDTLDMHAHTDTFHRFDKFNLKYNPIGELRLREIFLKTDNFIGGRYLAELTSQVFEDLENSKYQHVELRISIYGRLLDEWDKLLAWVVDNKLFSSNVRWLIQVPRLYDVYKRNGQVSLFQDLVTNLFRPLFEVLLDARLHPKLYVFLQRVVGFDLVDDELKLEKLLTLRKFPRASEWSFAQNPPYLYYLYYLYANITALNNLRQRAHLNTFLLRPHCGEAGDPEHLISAFLTLHLILHGILLRKIPFMQYLYYLDQVGLAMSPLLNNALFLTYDKNPFYSFYRKGMNVSLLTDDPLQFLYTKEPLIEEYLVAAQIYKLLGVDMCELACNSVKQLGWEDEIKRHWLGKNYAKPGVEGNDVEKTNVPDIRVNYRDETLRSELEMIKFYSGQH
jgi:AMP deaminase